LLKGENPERKSSKKLSLKDYKAKKEAEERARLSTESETSEPTSQVVLVYTGPVQVVRIRYPGWVKKNQGPDPG
jgi:hypothetical protein